jgi:hypothetical protein
MSWTQPQQLAIILINVIGGVAVIGSYVQGLMSHTGTEGIWGGVPGTIRPFYFAFMFFAAAGYFAFTYFILFRLNPGEVLVFNRLGYWVFPVIYALILFPSALWMPLTYAAASHPSTGLCLGIRVTLVVVGLAALALLAALLGLNTRDGQVPYWFAVGGVGAFCVQTAVLDAVVWSAFFRC